MLIQRVNGFMLRFTAGLLQGALKQIGVPSKVKAEFDTESVFTINLGNE
jgi:hypothetical protein